MEHTCNLSYLGGQSKKIASARPAWVTQWVSPLSQNKIQKKLEIQRCGRMALDLIPTATKRETERYRRIQRGLWHIFCPYVPSLPKLQPHYTAPAHPTCWGISCFRVLPHTFYQPKMFLSFTSHLVSSCSSFSILKYHIIRRLLRPLLYVLFLLIFPFFPTVLLAWQV